MPRHQFQVRLIDLMLIAAATALGLSPFMRQVGHLLYSTIAHIVRKPPSPSDCAKIALFLGLFSAYVTGLIIHPAGPAIGPGSDRTELNGSRSGSRKS